jgi:thymidylate kinase
MDGVGKTTVAKKLAEKIGYDYLEKPLRFFFEDIKENNFQNLTKVEARVFNISDPLVRAWFFGLGNIFSMGNQAKTDLVLDRHFASNYFWNGSKESDIVFKTIIEIIGKPDVTILLYANPEIRMKRLHDRNPQDRDIFDPEMRVSGYDKMVKFLKDYDIPYNLIDTENKGIEEVVAEAYNIVSEKIKK